MEDISLLLMVPSLNSSIRSSTLPRSVLIRVSRFQALSHRQHLLRKREKVPVQVKLRPARTPWWLRTASRWQGAFLQTETGLTGQRGSRMVWRPRRWPVMESWRGWRVWATWSPSCRGRPRLSIITRRNLQPLDQPRVVPPALRTGLHGPRWTRRGPALLRLPASPRAEVTSPAWPVSGPRTRGCVASCTRWASLCRGWPRGSVRWARTARSL